MLQNMEPYERRLAFLKCSDDKQHDLPYFTRAFGETCPAAVAQYLMSVDVYQYYVKGFQVNVPPATNLTTEMRRLGMAGTTDGFFDSELQRDQQGGLFDGSVCFSCNAYVCKSQHLNVCSTPPFPGPAKAGGVRQVP